MPVSRSMRRSGHPNRPSARTCCCRDVPKTCPMATEEHKLPVAVNVSVDGAQEMAGFEVSINGRFWASTEDETLHETRRDRASTRSDFVLLQQFLRAGKDWL